MVVEGKTDWRGRTVNTLSPFTCQFLVIVYARTEILLKTSKESLQRLGQVT